MTQSAEIDAARREGRVEALLDAALSIESRLPDMADEDRASAERWMAWLRDLADREAERVLPPAEGHTLATCDEGSCDYCATYVNPPGE